MRIPLTNNTLVLIYQPCVILLPSHQKVETAIPMKEILSLYHVFMHNFYYKDSEIDSDTEEIVEAYLREAKISLEAKIL